MLIDILALRKICIKEAGVDIGLLKMHQSQSATKEAKRFLRELDSLYPNTPENPNPNAPKIIESKIIENFNANIGNKKRYKYLAQLLSEAFPDTGSKKICGETYHTLRGKLVGIEDYDETTQKKVQENWRHEYSTNNGIYSILQGNEKLGIEQNQPQLAAAAARKNQRRNK
jgi:hypothetical protein